METHFKTNCDKYRVYININININKEFTLFFSLPMNETPIGWCQTGDWTVSVYSLVLVDNHQVHCRQTHNEMELSDNGVPTLNNSFVI